MKVGVFLEGFSPESGGGYTIQADIFHALTELIAETHHSFVLFCRRPADFEKYLGKQLSAVAFPGRFGERAIAKAQRSVDSLVDSRKTQTRLEQVAKTAGVEFMWFVGAEALQTDFPYMAIVWDLQHRLQPWFPEVSSHGTWRNREAFYGEYLRRATFVIAGTDAGRLEIERFYQIPTDRIKILPHPTPLFALDTPQLDSEAVRKKYGLSGPYVFYPAQFWSHKNHVNLLLALSELKAKHKLDISAVFAGSDKGNREYVQGFASRLEPAVNIAFLGFIPVEDLVALYQGAVALTYISYFGPENLPPLEAFALGCPVIAADVSGAREQLSDAAILVDPSEPSAISDAIRLVYESPDLRRELITKGRDRAERWTAKDFVRGVFATLNDFEKVRRCWNAG